MAVVIKMPKQGQSVESCILTEWYKNVGDKVTQGELLFAYETDKAAFEEEATAEGILLVQFYEVGDEVPVLENIGVIGSEGKSIEEYRPGGVSETMSKPTDESAKMISGSVVEESKRKIPLDQAIQPKAKILQDHTHPCNHGRVTISPRASKLAKKKRILFNGISGTGPMGRIIERNILEEIKKGKRLTPLAKKKVESEGLFVPSKGKSPYGKITTKDLVEAAMDIRYLPQGKYSDIPLSNMRKIIANAMLQSLQNSAQLTHHLSAEASNMLQLRKEVKYRMKKG